MAGKELLGNLMTENLVAFAAKKGIDLKIDLEEFNRVCGMAEEMYNE